MTMPFESIAQLRAAFDAGLLRLAEQEALGPFILVAANATFDPRLYQSLQTTLRTRFTGLAEHYVDAFRKGLNVAAADEDLLVFMKMYAAGFDRLQSTQMRDEGPWRIQFNHLRSFRPRRISTSIPKGISAPFSAEGFHFNKPFMPKERFWQGELCGLPADLYYNKYPFVDLHGLLVPAREQCKPQFLTVQDHAYIWRVAAELGQQLCGIGFGYNGFGAFASVNHLHYQMFVAAEPLPVEAPNWAHNGGAEPYPADCRAFDASTDAWSYIEHLHERAQPYNILYRAQRCYVFARRAQGTVEVPRWSSGFTWFELSGTLIAFNHDDFAHLDAGQIRNELIRLRV